MIIYQRVDHQNKGNFERLGTYKSKRPKFCTSITRKRQIYEVRNMVDQLFLLYSMASTKLISVIQVVYELVHWRTCCLLGLALMPLQWSGKPLLLLEMKGSRVGTYKEHVSSVYFLFAHFVNLWILVTNITLYIHPITLFYFCHLKPRSVYWLDSDGVCCKWPRGLQCNQTSRNPKW